MCGFGGKRKNNDKRNGGDGAGNGHACLVLLKAYGMRSDLQVKKLNLKAMPFPQLNKTF